MVHSENIVKISFVGDIFPANMPYKTGFGVASKWGKWDYNSWSKKLSKYFTDADIVFGNLESPILPIQSQVENKIFAGSPTFLMGLKKSGFNILSVANNHIMEHGEEGFRSTLKELNNAGIKHIGEGINDTSNIEYFQLKNLKIGLASFNDIHDQQEPLLYAKFNEERIFNVLDEMINLNTDIKILSLHWGNEYIGIPRSDQIRFAHKLIDRGANIIAGHHPHVIQPVEYYKNGLIFYSLGNFIFDMMHSKSTRRGIIAEVSIKKKSKEINHKIRKIKISRSYFPEPADYKIPEKKVFEKYLKFFNLNPDQYQSYYEKLKKKYRLRHRLLMKWEFLTMLHKMQRKSLILMLQKAKKRING